MHAWLVAAALAAALLAGCGDAPAASGPGAGPSPAEDTMSIEGVVVDEGVRPVAGALVVLDGISNATSGADGRFSFPALALAPHLLAASAPGFEPAVATVQPQPGTVAVQLELVAIPLPGPTNRTLVFHGIYECGAETVIVTGSCGRLLTYAQGEGVPAPDDPFQANGTFVFDVPEDWATIVLDLDFAAQSGLDGLRMAVRDDASASQATDYEDVATFHGGSSYSARIEPGGDYGAEKPVPPGAGLFQVEVFPQGHLWHPGGAGVLGAGAGIDITFDLYVTVFTVEPAPAGFTLL